MKKIAVVGCKGKMGRIICDLLKSEFLVVGIDRFDSIENFSDLDLVIDFASHESSVVSAEYCLYRNIPMIIGSTGQTMEENKRLDEISKHIKVIRKANFASGIKILKNFVIGVLELNPYRFEIIEKHHINKKDMPSGTALELENFIGKRFNGPIDIKSIREGQEMGEHVIVAYIGNETLSIKHNVFSRDVFAIGVLEEARKILNMT